MLVNLNNQCFLQWLFHSGHLKIFRLTEVRVIGIVWTRVSELEFNVPFQHKHGYIRDEYGREKSQLNFGDDREYSLQTFLSYL